MSTVVVRGSARRRDAAFDLVVLGGGTAGLVAAVIAGELGARVALVERAATGGDCLWTGCVPSKALLAAGAVAQGFRTAGRVGIEPAEPEVDFGRVMAHVRGSRELIAPHDSPERLRRSGVEVVEAEACFAAPGVVSAGSRTLHARSTLIATGSRPLIPEVRGLAGSRPLTTDTLWHIDDRPDRLVVVGAAATGCELAQAFARLGSSVTLVERAEALLPGEEPEAQKLIAGRLREEGVDVRLGTRLTRVEAGAVHLEGSAAPGAGCEPATVPFDHVLLAAGRTPDTSDLGLEAVGVATDRRGAVRVDGRLRTTAAAVYAAGDVIGELPFTHVAAYHARVAVVNALFGLRRRVDHRAVPWVTFTDPEVARVGLSEAQARERWGKRAGAEHHPHADLDRAIVAGEREGFAKLVSDPRGRLVGATIVGPSAGEAVGELAARLAARDTITDLAEAVHAYPTFAEGPVRAAEERTLRRWTRPGAGALTRSVLALRRLTRPEPRPHAGGPGRTTRGSRG